VKKAHVFIGLVLCVMFTSAIVALFKLEPPAGAREPLLLLIGSLSAAFGAFVNFAFGSSAGSARKDELLAQSAPVDTSAAVVTSTTSVSEGKP